MHDDNGCMALRASAPSFPKGRVRTLYPRQGQLSFGRRKRHGTSRVLAGFLFVLCACVSYSGTASGGTCNDNQASQSELPPKRVDRSLAEAKREIDELKIIAAKLEAEVLGGHMAAHRYMAWCHLTPSKREEYGAIARQIELRALSLAQMSPAATHAWELAADAKETYLRHLPPDEACVAAEASLTRAGDLLHRHSIARAPHTPR